MSNKNIIEISYYMKIALDVNKKVGGTRAYQAEANARDRFLITKDLIHKNFHYVKAKLEERERRRGDAHQINAQIKQKIEQIYNQLERMKESVISQKNASEASRTVKNDMVQKLTSQTRELQDLIDNESALQRKIFQKEREQTMTEMKQKLVSNSGAKGGRLQSKPQYSNGPVQIQLRKMEQWRQKDAEIDQGVEQIIEGIKRWKEGLKITNELTNQSQRKIIELSTNVDEVNETLFESNKKLKGIVEKLRKPHKFCLDVILVLILIGLIVGIIKLSGG